MAAAAGQTSWPPSDAQGAPQPVRTRSVFLDFYLWIGKKNVYWIMKDTNLMMIVFY